MAARRIAIDARALATSSGGYIRGLLHGLAGLGEHQRFLILADPRDFKLIPKSPNLTKVKAPFGSFSMAEQLGFHRLLTSLKPDLVHFCFPQHPVVYQGRFVVTIHDTIMFDFPQPGLTAALKRAAFRPVFGRALKRAARLITPSNHVRQRLIDNWGVPPERLETIYEAGQLFVKAGQLPTALRGKDYLLVVNNGLPHKNNWQLVQAHQDLLADWPHLHLVFVGQTDKHRRRLQRRLAGIRACQIILCDRLPQAQLAASYAQALALVTASLAEGFGLPGLEAMHWNTPVIVSRVACLPEVYGPAAAYFDPTSLAATKRALALVLKDETHRQTLIKAGRIRCREFSWRKTAQATARVYQSVLTAG